MAPKRNSAKKNGGGSSPATNGTTNTAITPAKPKPGAGPGADPAPTTNDKTGLTHEQYLASLKEHGKNEIPKIEVSLWWLFFKQFTGAMPLILELVFAVLVIITIFWDTGEATDAAIIFAMMMVNGLLGFREEKHAKVALDALTAKMESTIGVIRDGKTEVRNIADLVPGDIVFLVGGTIVPADVLWVRGDNLSVDTAALTGEPIPRTYPSPQYGKGKKVFLVF